MINTVGRAEYESIKFRVGNHPKFPTYEETVYINLEDDTYDSSVDMYFVRDGKLYEFAAGHCSCNGYEECYDDFDDITRMSTTPEAVLLNNYLDPELVLLLKHLQRVLALN